MNDEAQQGRNRRRWAGGLIALAAAVLAAGCTAPADDAVETVVVSTVAVAAAGSTQAQQTSTARPRRSWCPRYPGGSGRRHVGTRHFVIRHLVRTRFGNDVRVREDVQHRRARPPTATTPPKPKPKPTVVASYPKDGATGVSPLGQIKVVAWRRDPAVRRRDHPGRPQAQRRRTEQGQVVWTLIPELGYDRTYTSTSPRRPSDGTVTRTASCSRTTAGQSHGQRGRQTCRGPWPDGRGRPADRHHLQTGVHRHRRAGARSSGRRPSRRAPSRPASSAGSPTPKLHWRPTTAVEGRLQGRRRHRHLRQESRATRTYGGADRSSVQGRPQHGRGGRRQEPHHGDLRQRQARSIAGPVRWVSTSTPPTTARTSSPSGTRPR